MYPEVELLFTTHKHSSLSSSSPVPPGIRVIDIHPCETRVAVVDEAGTLFVWDFATSSLLLRLPLAPAHDAAWPFQVHADGRGGGGRLGRKRGG
ncbi:WD40/YVTN repeat-like-containing domain protein [Nannochloropsis gaditana]|uniref:WD40/YVTN repeat-like-containing domain protein n=1 Tax=Nannochloropsis gaditana TaxID=72520 RepID=W7TQ39_9STRA|nr:WD40/YVTN repeat-like-containing domain protein [Nannochloropsis gaditana]